MNASSLGILALGFVLGMRHATDPDHVIAVSTIVSRERSVLRAGWIGVLWGCGHTLTILIVGSAIILFGLAIPVRVGLTMEFSVGLMLILLGMLNLTGILRWFSERFSPTHAPVEGRHAHLHGHGSKLHYHWHKHRGQGQHHGDMRSAVRMRGAVQGLGWFHTLRPLLVGIVHGLAGSAAVALLILATIRVPQWAVLYLLVFGVGTIAGMMLITAALALPFSVAGPRFGWLNRGLITASGVVSLAFGLFIVYQIGLVDGLLTSHPVWTPR